MRKRLLFICAAAVLLANVTTVSARAQGGGQAQEAARGLLVIAPQPFHAALGDYVRHKRAQLPTTLVSLETVLRDTPGVDDAEKLKRYLYAAWHDRRIGYALLVGDADVMPVRYMVLDRVTPAAYDYAFYPSDLYYADIARNDGSFDDWNGSKEGFHAGYFGEVRGEKNKTDPMNYDHIAYHPKLAVGRWPVSTADEARLVATKTITYENGIRRGDKPGARRAALFAVSGWFDMRGQMDGLAAKLGSGWSADRYYWADGTRDDHTPAPTEPDLIAALDAGVGLMIHAGHGSDNTWDRCFNVAHLDRVNNADRLPILMSAGCSTARFATLPPYEAYLDVYGSEHKGTDAGEVFNTPPPPPACYQKGRYNPTGLGEQLLRHGPSGAVAYIGCNTGGQPCGMTLVEGLVRAVGSAKGARLGDCWNQAIIYYYDREHLATLMPTSDWYPASIFFQGMKYMLFGDPSLLLPSAGKPATSVASPPATPLAQALDRAGANGPQIEQALREAPASQREGMRFLVENMPDTDLRTLTSNYLLENVAIAYAALENSPWKARIPKDLFLNDILPYSCLNEKRDDSRRFLHEKAAPLVAGCDSPAEAAQRLNQKLFPLLNARYSTERKRPDQSPLETVESGKATCSGLSILLVDACRAVGIPARVAGTPMWTNMRGNHTWVEIWDGDWHFAGAAEPDPAGLDHGWFVGDASRAKPDVPEHAIYATSFKRTGTSFPLVWAPDVEWVPAVNVTERYLPAKPGDESGKGRLLIKVVDRNGRRVEATVKLTPTISGVDPMEGVSRGESADLNDMLTFRVLRICPAPKYVVIADYRGKSARQEVRAGGQAEQIAVIRLP